MNEDEKKEEKSTKITQSGALTIVKGFSKWVVNPFIYVNTIQDFGAPTFNGHIDGASNLFQLLCI